MQVDQRNDSQWVSVKRDLREGPHTRAVETNLEGRLVSCFEVAGLKMSSVTLTVYAQKFPYAEEMIEAIHECLLEKWMRDEKKSELCSARAHISAHELDQICSIMWSKVRIFPGRRFIEPILVVCCQRAGTRCVRVLRRAVDWVGVDKGAVGVAFLHEAFVAVALHCRIPHVAIELSNDYEISRAVKLANGLENSQWIDLCMSRYQRSC